MPIGSEPVFGTITPLSVDDIIGRTAAQATDAWYDLEPAQVSLKIHFSPLRYPKLCHSAHLRA
jgi:hypothetical protein